MKLIYMTMIAFTFSVGAQATCLNDIEARIRPLEVLSPAGSYFEMGGSENVYANGGLQVTEVIVNEIGVDGESTGNGAVYKAAVQPTDADKTSHLPSQSCDVVGLKKVN